MAQFPLGSVLFPSMILPLHVFEPRYRQLAADVLAGDQEFGVVLIERGNEVGGGEVRTIVGTVAKVLEAETFDDGRSALISVGTRRIRITNWLPDAPYPQAEVEDWPDDPIATSTRETLDEIMVKIEQGLALAEAAGHQMGPLPELSEDLALASMQAATLAPIGQLDKQRLLETPGPDERFTLLDQVVDDALDVLRFRFGNDE